MTIHAIQLPGGYEVSDDRARLDLNQVHEHLVAGAYWAKGRHAAQTERSWTHCLAGAVWAPGGALAGFGRVLTDFTFRAHLGDVFILPEQRGRGIGKALVRFFLEHPALAGVELWTLTTQDAHGLYRRHGFELVESDGKAMVLHRKVGAGQEAAPVAG